MFLILAAVVERETATVARNLHLDAKSYCGEVFIFFLEQKACPSVLFRFVLVLVL